MGITHHSDVSMSFSEPRGISFGGNRPMHHSVCWGKLLPQQHLVMTLEMVGSDEFVEEAFFFFLH